MSASGERRVVRHAVSQIEMTEAAIGQVQMHLFTKPPFGPDAEAITQQHSDQQLRLNGWPTGVALEIFQIGVDSIQIDKAINRAQ